MNRTTDTLTVRGYDPTDRQGVRTLYEQAWNHPASPAWFDWKYSDNPFIEGDAFVVAECGGKVVGIRPAFDLPMRAGGRTVDGTLFSNTMVHPDHRGEGVFSAMTAEALARAADRGRDLVFAFGNENSAPAYRHWSWADVGRCPKWYRVQDPGSILGFDDGWLGGGADTVSRLVARSYLRVRDAFADDRADLAIHRKDDPSATQLSALYRRDRPERLHVERTEAFYRWRLGSPRVDPTAFVASRDERPLATTLARERDLGHGTAVQLFDVLPLSTGRDEQMQAAVSALLRAIVETYGDAAAVTAPGTVWESLASRGFVANASVFVPSSLSTGLTLFATGVGDSVDPFADRSAWALAGTVLETD